MSYADRQYARDATYTRDYRAWVTSLPAEERARLAAQDLDAPDASRRASTRLGDPVALERAASGAPTPRDHAEGAGAAAPEPAPPQPEAQGTTPRIDCGSNAAADVLASFCARIRAHPNPLLAFDALCFATGLMEVEGLSEAALAARHGVTRAAFSKIAVQWTETFALPPSRGMRSKRARRVCRQARLNFLDKANGAQTKAA